MRGLSVDDLLQLLSAFSGNENSGAKDNQNSIPKEVLDQYPYGQFPTQYTKAGQEIIRKQSENRFSYSEPPQNETPPSPQLNISALLPLIQLLSNKQQPKDIFKVLSKLLFKDNKDMQKLFDIFSPTKSQELKKQDDFPDTKKVNISSLKRIN